MNIGDLRSVCQFFDLLDVNNQNVMERSDLADLGEKTAAVMHEPEGDY